MKRRAKRKTKQLPMIFIIIAIGLALYFYRTYMETPTPDIPSGESLRVDILDVGQADCVLVRTGGQTMLIDAGNLGQDELVLGYLSDYGVKKLDYLVATHPHADHIGAMAAVIREIDSIETVLMPDITHTTATFERLLEALESRDMQFAVPEAGDTFEMGSARVTVIAPAGDEYKELNDYSIVLRIEYGKTSFLFTGDAEHISEEEQLDGGYTLRADVLKVGHHGSSSSTTEQYLKAVSPDYAAISCGENNTYGHPHRETMERLASHGVKIFRTDEKGTISFITDGETISVNTER